MTIICVAKDANGLALVADGQITGGGIVISDQMKKIWRVTQGGSDWLFAGTGSVRNIQVVQHQFTPPHGDETNLMRYMVGTFVPSLRTTLQEAGQEATFNGVARPDSVEMIVARGRSVFGVQANYCVIEITAPNWAAGSGSCEALGAMFATGKETAADIATVGVEAAIKFDAYCSGEIQVEILSTEGAS